MLRNYVFLVSHIKVFLFIVTIGLGLIPNALAKDHPSEHTLLVVGDSLSAAYGLLENQGWVSLLQKRWERENHKIKIVNAAISGETTDGGLARLPRLLTQHTPTHVLIELGGNDGLRGQNVTKMRSNLTKMIELSAAAGAKVILQDIEIPTNYGKRYTEMFSQSYEILAEKYEVPVIPFFLESIALNPDLMQADGIHPTAEAQPMVAEFMSTQLLPLINAD